MSMNDDIRKIVVVNVPYGKFQLPEEAFKDYKEVSNQPDLINCRHIRRDDKNLVWIVEELIAEGNFNQLKIVKIPPYIKWNVVCHNDGIEHVHEYHNAW